MRIDAISKASQLYQATKPKKVSEVKKADGRDRYEVSKSAKDYQTAKAAVNSAPDIREDKVRDIKE